jgi:LysR family transcriptional regulator, hydrogen peroxide-inducible genes activator
MPVREVSMVFARPFAKMRTVDAISGFIQHEISKELISSKYKKDNLLVAKI